MVASNPEPQADREATDWFVRLQSRSISTEELTDFARWRRDPGNARAYERAEAIWNASHALNGDPDIGAALGRAMGRRRIRRWLAHVMTDRIALTVGASVAALAVVIFALPIPLHWADAGYQTGVGERSIIQLADGSHVQLDTSSHLIPHVTGLERHVELASGQAYFDVHHDPAHPFVVDVGDGTTVTALGTRFDVRRDDASIRVSLFAGSVAVADAASGNSVRLLPGEAVSVSNGAFGRVTTIAAGNQPGWRDGRLSFRETPLKTAVAEVNRYTKQPLRLAKPELASQPVSGDFSTNDIDGFAAAANAIFGAGAVVRDADHG